MIQIHLNFVPNIFFTKLVKYFGIYLQKTWRAGQVILKFGVLSNEVVLRKKLENKNFTWAALLGANISQIFSSSFSSENIFWNIWSFALGFLMHHSTRPQTSHCLHCSQIVTEDDNVKSSWNIYWKWNWTQIYSQIFCLK